MCAQMLSLLTEAVVVL